MKNNNSPLVSVLMPAYNHENYLRFAVESVLGQTYSNLELIIIDDASQDGSWGVLQSFSDERIRLYRHDTNQGAHSTLNEAVSLANGTIIAIINSDDIYYPDRLQSAISLLIAEPAVGAVVTYYDFLDDSGNVIQDATSLAVNFPDASRYLGEVIGKIGEIEMQTLLLLARNYYHTTSNLVIRRDVIDQVGPFRSFRYVHDYDFFLRLSIHYPVRMIKESLLGYRIHATNTFAESDVASAMESATILADFMLTHELKFLRKSHPAYSTVLAFFLSELCGHGLERLILFSVLSETVGSLNRGVATPLFKSFASDQKVFDRVAILLRQDRAVQDLRWQERQTTHWWGEAAKALAERDKLGHELWKIKQEVWQLNQESWDVKQALWQAEKDRDYNKQQVTWLHDHAQGLESTLAELSARYERTFSVRIIRLFRAIHASVRRYFLDKNK
jgi:glycosyltransferase involved in cell wall biosynthesis